MLQLYKMYTRVQVHAHFVPGEPFPHGGQWGMQGIVSLKGSKDYVFLVSLGTTQSGHRFVEDITPEGVLTWQSQPRQGFKAVAIQDFIHHDSSTSNIYLFFRNKKAINSDAYMYLGTLSYLGHDPSREKPVYFKWQLMSWHPTPEVISYCNVKLASAPAVTEPDKQGQMIVKINTGRGGATKHRRSKKRPPITFPRMIDFEQQRLQNDETGRAGEEFALKFEKDYLIQAGRQDLADQVVWMRDIDNGAPYDIKSFNPDGTEKYIEVKTTTGDLDMDFYLSQSELNYFHSHKNEYYLYRLYGLGQGSICLTVIRDLDAECLLQPRNYTVSLK